MNDNIYYATNSEVSHNEEDFRITVVSHNAGRSYALSPKHAKRLLLSLTSHIAQYEERHGKIHAKLEEKPETPNLDRRLGFTPQQITDIKPRPARVTAKKRRNIKG